MIGTLSIADLIKSYFGVLRSTQLVVEKRIRFSLQEIFTRQREINALWRECNQRNLHPVATTFLGKITTITLQP